MKSRFEKARKALIFWTLWIGLGAVAGAACMLIDPSCKIMGMDAMLPFFQKMPLVDVLFQNFVFSGISLLIVNGLTNLTAAVLLLRRKHAGVVLGGFFGITLMLWICIQFWLLPTNVMSTLYFLFGLAQALTGYAAWVFERQETFAVRREDDSQIGTNPKRLVVFFSRMGYVRRKAFEEAARTGAEVYEIQAAERTEGTLGFWWCGRYAMHRWPMPIRPVTVDLTAYEHVTICSPIWAFAQAAPVRAFCQAASGKIREADYLLVHFSPASYENAADEMDRLLGLKRTGFRSFVCRTGRFREMPKKPSAHLPA